MAYDVGSHHDHPYANGHIMALATPAEPDNDHLQRLRILSTLPWHEQVENWLAETRKEDSIFRDTPHSSTGRDKPCSFGLGSFKEHARQDVHPDINGQGLCPDRKMASFEPHRRFDSSSCSSYLEPGLAARPGSKSRRTSKDDKGIGFGETSTSVIARREGNCPVIFVETDDTQSVTRRPNEVFEKRKRRKTREDRYTIKKKSKGIERQDVPERRKKPLEKTRPRRKGLRKSGKNLMEAFSSKSVGQDRLTMRPTQALGLFQNGRASCHVRRRGLPDLAFSEMEFLQRAKHLTVDIEEKKYSSTYQDMGGKQSQITRNDISEHFKPNAHSFPKLSPVRVSDSHRNDAPGGLPRVPYEQHINSQQLPNLSTCTSQLASLPNLEFPELACHKSFSEGLNKADSIRKPSLGAVISTDSRGKVSDGATTLYTWSESARTPELAREMEVLSSRASTTPDSVRRSMERTGIFNGTGIHRAVHRRDNRSTHNSDVPLGCSKLLEHKICAVPLDQMLEESSYTEHLARHMEHENCFNTPTCAAIGHAKPHSLSLNSKPLTLENQVLHETEPVHIGESIAERCNQRSGWRSAISEKSGQCSQDFTAGEITEHLPRQAIAQRAYLENVSEPAKTAKNVKRAECDEAAGHPRLEKGAIRGDQVQYVSSIGLNEDESTSLQSPTPRSVAAAIQNDAAAIVTCTCLPSGAASVLPSELQGDKVKQLSKNFSMIRESDAQSSGSGIAYTSVTPGVVIREEKSPNLVVSMTKIDNALNTTASRDAVARQLQYERLPQRGVQVGRVSNQAPQRHMMPSPSIISSFYVHQLRDHMQPSLSSFHHGSVSSMNEALEASGKTGTYDAIDPDEGDEIFGFPNLHECPDFDKDISPWDDFGDGWINKQDIGTELPSEIASVEHLYEDLPITAILAEKCHSEASPDFFHRPDDQRHNQESIQPFTRQEHGNIEADIVPLGFWQPFRHY